MASWQPPEERPLAGVEPSLPGYSEQQAAAAALHAAADAWERVYAAQRDRLLGKLTEGERVDATARARLARTRVTVLRVWAAADAE